MAEVGSIGEIPGSQVVPGIASSHVGQDGLAALVVVRGDGLGRRHVLEDELVIGYDADRDIVVGNPDVLLYASLRRTDEGVVVERHPRSEVLIKVNDTPIEHKTLADGDLIQVGFVLLKFIQRESQVALDGAFHDEIFRLSTIDPITQVYNRRYFTEAFEREISRARRYERGLSLLMVEIDGIAGMAIDQGRKFADELMHGVADLVSARARTSDVVGQYDREVLCIALPEEDAVGAMKAGEALREAVAGAKYEVGGAARNCTISVGVAQLDDSHDTLDDLIRLTANRLWVAKERGGDRCNDQGG